MNTIRTLTGTEAIRLAEDNSFTLRKYADPTEGARDVSLEEARNIAKQDPSLIYAVVIPVGWNAKQDQTVGYHYADYFDARGVYQGPDDDGVEPQFEDAPTTEGDAWDAQMQIDADSGALERALAPTAEEILASTPFPKI